MKIQTLLQLLNEAETKPILAYHATSANHLRSILKTGLVPNKESGGYAAGEKSSAGYELAALPGIYFYKDYYKAFQLAKHMSGKNQADSVIICAQIQPKTAEMDEDRLNDDGLLNDKVIMQIARSGIDPEELHKEAMSLLVQNLQAKGLNAKTIKNAIPTAKDYVRTVIAYATNGSKENEQVLRQQKDEMTRKLKKLVVSDSEQGSFKVNETIGFSGANRIVGLYLLTSGMAWGNVGGLTQDVAQKVKNPIDLVQGR